jgi:hypothetical protein
VREYNDGIALNLAAGPPTHSRLGNGEFLRMRLMISALAAVAVIAVGTTMLWSRPAAIELSAATAAMPTLLELHTIAGANTLPAGEVEDQSLVFPTVTKR